MYVVTDCFVFVEQRVITKGMFELWNNKLVT